MILGFQVSLGRKVFVGEVFGFKLLPSRCRASFPPSLSTVGADTESPSKKKIYLRQVPKLGGRPPKRERKLQCAGVQLLSNARQNPASPTHRAMLGRKSQRSLGLGLLVTRMVTTIPIWPWKREMDLTQRAEGSQRSEMVLEERGL